MSFREWLSAFGPGPDTTPLSEKFRSSFAIWLGILLLALGVHALFPAAGFLGPTLMASMGAAGVLIYAAPHSPMAQPWPLIIGNLLSGIVGILCANLISETIWAASCAAGLAVLVMHFTRSLHPPGAASALFMVLHVHIFHAQGWEWAAWVVLANVLFSLTLALAINNLLHRGRYPMRPHPVPGTPPETTALSEADVEWALGQMEGVMDVSSQDLLEIYRLASERAQNKQRIGRAGTD